VCEDRRLSYRWVEEQSNRLANGLLRSGIERGDRVAVCLDNSVDAVLSIFAILKAGAAFVLVNPTIKPDKLAYMLNDSGSRMLLAKGSRIREIGSCLKDTPGVQTLVLSGEPSAGRTGFEDVMTLNELLAEHADSLEPPPKRCIDVDIASLIYTSGSTGRPKGVVMSHLNMIAAATSVTQYLHNTAEDVILNVLPLSFSYGLYQVLTAFKVGATVVLERSFAYPHGILQRLTDEGATGFALVPTISAVLLQLDLSAYRFPSLRYLTNAGAALPPEHIPRLRALFPHTQLFLMYGLTECKRVSYLPPDQLDIRPGSVGKAMPNVEAYVVDENGRRLPPGETGELVVRGSNVMLGYWNLPEETERVLKAGPTPGERVLHTGDLFRMDTEGYLYFVGRRDDMIKSRGEKVSPTEVENVLYRLGGVAMAAVVGIPDPILGAAVKAVIALQEGVTLTENDVLRHCARHLEDFMVPKVVEFRQTIPRTAAGKIDRLELSEGLKR
jgi:amino acid adenylation domain-containing protein